MVPRMRMMITILGAAGLAGMLLAAPRGAVSEEKTGKFDGQKIFADKCLKCHKVEKFRSLQYDRKSWEMVLSRMERSKNCVLGEDESVAVADYLSKQYGD